jgi:hypothetical protein
MLTHHLLQGIQLAIRVLDAFVAGIEYKFGQEDGEEERLRAAVWGIRFEGVDEGGDLVVLGFGEEEAISYVSGSDVAQCKLVVWWLEHSELEDEALPLSVSFPISVVASGLTCTRCPIMITTGAFESSRTLPFHDFQELLREPKLPFYDFEGVLLQGENKALLGVEGTFSESGRSVI